MLRKEVYLSAAIQKPKLKKPKREEETKTDIEAYQKMCVVYRKKEPKHVHSVGPILSLSNQKKTEHNKTKTQTNRA